MEEQRTVNYDGEADALYVYLSPGARGNQVVTFSAEDGSVAVDVGEGGELIGIEVLGASKHPLFNRLIPKLAVGTNLRRFEWRSQTE